MNLDKTFCASPMCKNECGRKMPQEVRDYINKNNLDVWWGYFCSEPEKLSNVEHKE